jgi:hypothetical protein
MRLGNPGVSHVPPQKITPNFRQPPPLRFAKFPAALDLGRMTKTKGKPKAKQPSLPFALRGSIRSPKRRFCEGRTATENELLPLFPPVQSEAPLTFAANPQKCHVHNRDNLPIHPATRKSPQCASEAQRALECARLAAAFSVSKLACGGVSRQCKTCPTPTADAHAVPWSVGLSCCFRPVPRRGQQAGHFPKRRQPERSGDSQPQAARRVGEAQQAARTKVPVASMTPITKRTFAANPQKCHVHNRDNLSIRAHTPRSRGGSPLFSSTAGASCPSSLDFTSPLLHHSTKIPPIVMFITATISPSTLHLPRSRCGPPPVSTTARGKLPRLLDSPLT